MTRQFKKLGNAGDTIVEVLIVLAVLGLSMSIAYATANTGLQKSRNAQEHSQALGIINSQVELLRSTFAKQAGGSIETQAASGPFCLSPSASAPVTITPLSNSGPNKFNESLAADTLNTTTYPGPCTQDAFYKISIVGRGGGVYDFRVRWEGLGSLGRQQEELTYKIGNVTVSPTGGYSDPELPPPPPFSGWLNVVAQVIPPNGPTGTSTNPTPSCTSAGVNRNGTTVSLTGPTGTSVKTTDNTSTAAFTGLQQGSTYNINVSRPGFALCPGGPTSAVASTSTPPPVVTKKIYPVCSPTTTYSGYWAYGARHPELDGYYYTIPPAVNAYAGAYSSFVAGPPYRWYVWSGDSSRAGQGLLYYYIWDATWVNTTTTKYNCPS